MTEQEQKFRLQICEEIKLLVEEEAYTNQYGFNPETGRVYPIEYEAKSIDCDDLFEILEKCKMGKINAKKIKANRAREKQEWEDKERLEREKSEQEWNRILKEYDEEKERRCVGRK